MILSIWPTQDLGNEDSDDEQPSLLGGGGSASGSSTKKRLPLCSMDVLSSWYRESFETMSRHVRAYSPAGTQGSLRQCSHKLKVHWWVLNFEFKYTEVCETRTRVDNHASINYSKFLDLAEAKVHCIIIHVCMSHPTMW